ncbi:hypothetical protein S245_044194, partial [Arachis hypogaea]
IKEIEWWEYIYDEAQQCFLNQGGASTVETYIYIYTKYLRKSKKVLLVLHFLSRTSMRRK